MSRRGAWHMECPFPPCEEAWWVNEVRTDVPRHDISGPSAAAWREMTGQPICPGTDSVYQTRTEITPNDDLRLVKELRRLMRFAQVKSDLERLPEIEQAERNKALPTDPDTRFLGVPMGRHPYVPDPANFPERRGDPGEPDKAWKPEATAPPVPATDDERYGQDLGRAAVDAANEQAKALVRLAINKVSEAETATNQIREHLAMIESLAVVLATNVDAAMALARAAVGSSGGDTKAGQDFMAFLLKVFGIASGESNKLLAAAAPASQYEGEASRSLAGAREAGEQYVA